MEWYNYSFKTVPSVPFVLSKVQSDSLNKHMVTPFKRERYRYELCAYIAVSLLTSLLHISFINSLSLIFLCYVEKDDSEMETKLGSSFD